MSKFLISILDSQSLQENGKIGIQYIKSISKVKINKLCHAGSIDSIFISDLINDVVKQVNIRSENSNVVYKSPFFGASVTKMLLLRKKSDKGALQLAIIESYSDPSGKNTSDLLIIESGNAGIFQETSRAFSALNLLSYDAILTEHNDSQLFLGERCEKYLKEYLVKTDKENSKLLLIGKRNLKQPILDAISFQISNKKLNFLAISFVDHIGIFDIPINETSELIQITQIKTNKSPWWMLYFNPLRLLLAFDIELNPGLRKNFEFFQISQEENIRIENLKIPEILYPEMSVSACCIFDSSFPGNRSSQGLTVFNRIDESFAIFSIECQK